MRASFARYGLLDDRVHLLPGWFRDTLPHAPIERLAVMRTGARWVCTGVIALTIR